MYYTLTVNSKVGSDDVVNVFYYRDTNVFQWPNAVWGGAESLAQAFKDDVLPKWVPIMPSSWNPQTIKVMPHNELFEPNTQLPHILSISDEYQGGRGEASTKGNGMCINFNFALKPAGIQGGIKPPRRGYVAIGPVDAGFINQYGELTPDTFALIWQTAGESFTETISDLLFNIGQFRPVRVAHNRALGGLVKWKAFADVIGGQWSTHVSWRRSRMPE